MKILLTGASGFLGSALALHWREAGHEVSLLLRPESQLYRLHGPDSGFNIGRCTADTEIDEFIAITQPQVVVHTACSYGRQGETHLQLFDANLRLGMVIMLALQRSPFPVTFINTGSSLPPNVNTYALSKYQFAHWGQAISRQSAGQLRFINVLLQLMYGPNDSDSKFTTHVMRACKRNEPTLNLTSGLQKRDFIYIEDVISAYDVLLSHSHKLEIYQNIDVGCGTASPIRDFAEIAHRLTASRTKLAFGALPHRPDEPMLCEANIGQMKQLGWLPAFDLEAGIKRTVELEFPE